MSLDLSAIKKWVIPEGEVQSVTVNGVVVWKKPADTPVTQANHIKGTASAEFTAKLGDVTLTFPAGNFDVEYTGAQLTTLAGVFLNKKTLTSITSWGIDTSAVKIFSYMFYNCTTMESVDVSTFNTAAATGFSNMFTVCSALTELDVSKFDTSNIDDMGGMFNGCKNMTKLMLGNKWNAAKVKIIKLMFNNCTSLTTINGALNSLGVSLSLSASPLNHDSAVRIINGLANVTTAQTLTLSSTTKNTLSATEKAVLINKGWTLA